MKKLLSLVSILTVSGFNTLSLISCSQNNSKNSKSIINKDLTNFKLNSNNIDLDKNDINEKSVINNIENQIQKYTNINFDVIKNDNYFYIDVENYDGQSYENHDGDKLNQKADLGNSNIKIWIDKKDTNFILNNCLELRTTITANSAKSNLDNLKLKDISIFEDDPTNGELLNEINKQIVNEAKNIDFGYLSRDLNYKYSVLESDGTSFNQDNIADYAAKTAAKGKILVTINFNNDLYINNFNKAFIINLSYKKNSLSNFNIKWVTLYKENNKNSDVIDNIYTQLSYAYEKEKSDFIDDGGLSINVVITDKKGKKISFNNNSDKKILNKGSFSGELEVTLITNDNSKIFYPIKKVMKTNIYVPGGEKISLDHFLINNINLTKEESTNDDVLGNISDKISNFAKIDIHNIWDDRDLIISITESDGTKFSTNTIDPEILEKTAVAGKTKINISVLKYDDYFSLYNSLSFNININIEK